MLRLSCGFFLFIWLLPFAPHAQLLFSPSRGNYAGLGGAAWNPATIADNRYSVQLQLFAVDGHTTNSTTGILGSEGVRILENGLALSSAYLSSPLSTRVNAFSAGLNLRGPGLFLRLSPRQSLAFSTRARTSFQGNEVSHVFWQNATEGFSTRGNATNNSFNLSANAVAEWDLTYGRVVYEQGAHFLKAGMTLKRLMGRGAAYVQAKNLNYDVGAQSYAAGDTTVRIRNVAAAIGFANVAAFQDMGLVAMAHWLEGGQTPGTGWGADFGVVYEYRPKWDRYTYRDTGGRERIDYSCTKYRFRLAASVVDLGAVLYNTQATAYQFQTSNLGVSAADINGLRFDTYETRANRVLGKQQASKTDHFTVGMPTTVNVDLDARIGGAFYVNMALSQGLRRSEAISLHSMSFASLTPRLETRYLEIALPLSLTNEYRQIAAGVMVRLGSLLLGSNNLSSLFVDNRPYGVNAYAEISLLSWANRRPKK